MLRLFLISTSIFLANVAHSKVYVPDSARICRMEISNQFPEVYCDGHKVKVLLTAEDPSTATLRDFINLNFKIIYCEINKSKNYSCLFRR